MSRFTASVREEDNRTFTAILKDHSLSTTYVERGFRWEGDAKEWNEALQWNLEGRPTDDPEED